MNISRSGRIAAATQLRKVTPDDRELIFGWRNLPEIVALSSSRRTVTATEHAAWFTAALADPARLLLVIEADGEPVGHVRIDGEIGGAATVSIYLIPGRTGQGIGVPALRAACQRAFDRGTTELYAFVREDNERSVAAFARAGFRAPETGTRPCPAGHTYLALPSPRPRADD